MAGPPYRPQDSQERCAVDGLRAWKARGDRHRRLSAHRQEEKLELSSRPTPGLIENFESRVGPSFDPIRLTTYPAFYEHAALYRLEVWSEVLFRRKFVLWLLVEIHQQAYGPANFPIFAARVAKGMTSEIVQLREPGTDAGHTVGLRRFKSTAKSFCRFIFHYKRFLMRQIPAESELSPGYGSKAAFICGRRQNC